MSLETEPVLENFLIEIKEEPLDHDENDENSDIFPSNLNKIENKSSEDLQQRNSTNHDNSVQFYLFEDGDLKRVKNRDVPYQLSIDSTITKTKANVDQMAKEICDDESVSSSDGFGNDVADDDDDAEEEEDDRVSLATIAVNEKKTNSIVVNKKQHINSKQSTKKKTKFKSEKGGSFHCELCPSKFTKESTYDAHIKIHRGENPYVCSECGHVLKSKGSLDSHMLIHTIGKGARRNRRENCKVCGKNIEVKGMAVHLRVHTGEKPLECHICLKRFNVNSNLKRHLRFHERPKVNIKCTICDKEFRLQVQLDEHMLVHGGEMKYKCDLCVEKFSTNRRLKVHMNTHKDVTYKCKYCAAEFTTARKLKDHRDVDHVEELENSFATKSFLCDFCGKKLLTKNAITAHMRSHTGEKPYKCDYCDKAFAASTYLMFHMRVHDGYRPYKCGFCEKSFAHKQSLMNHERTHTGEKPYECQLCQKRFTQSITLINHNKKFCPVIFPKMEKIKSPPKPKRVKREKSEISSNNPSKKSRTRRKKIIAEELLESQPEEQVVHFNTNMDGFLVLTTTTTTPIIHSVVTDVGTQ